jgi:hypothetical protein
LYYKSKTCWGGGPTKDDVMYWTPKDFKKYCSSKAYHDDFATAFPTPSLKPSQIVGTYGSFRGKRNGSGASNMTCPLTKHEVRQVIKQVKAFYLDKKGEKEFSAWNENVGEVTQIDLTHCGFKEYDVPNDAGEKAV